MVELEPNRTILIGWDGATFSVLDALMKDGTMPFLAQFAAEGVRGVLRTVVPALTPPAWTSLMTGRTPGQHGVFDFVKLDRRADRYTYSLGTSDDVCAETVWSVAGRNGCRVTCLNFPSMFPCRQKGPVCAGPTGLTVPSKDQSSLFVVPGWVPWQYLPRAVYPGSLYSRIRALPGFQARELALDWDLERKALQGLPEDQYESWIQFHMLRERQWFEILKMLMSEEPCQLTGVLFDGVDKLQHLCYHLLDPRRTEQFSSPWAKRIRKVCHEYFRQLDGFLEDITGLAGANARIFIASDHGFTLAGDQIFYANVWLEQHGYLRWAAGVPLDQARRLTLDGHTATDAMFDWAGTTAFALTASSNAIHIFRATDGGTGVRDSEYEVFRARLIDSLLAFTDDSGKPVLEAVLTREQAFPGQQMHNAPDLTLVLRDRSFLSVLRADAPLQPRISPYGTHDPDGVFFARGSGIPNGVEIPSTSILNITPTLLYSLGVAIPTEMDGAVETAAFEAWYLNSHPILTEAPGGYPVQPGRQNVTPVLEKEQEEALIARLRSLGYLE